MQALTAVSYTKPSGYVLSEIPIPSITTPNDVLVKIHAASITPGETYMAAGLMRMVMSAKFPIKFGLELSGTVVEVGDGVKDYNPGDEVYGLLPVKLMGTVAEYCVAPEEYLARKPPTLSHAEAAALPGVATTAIQVLDRASTLLAASGGLVGKTALVPAGLSGVGSIALQLLKRVYGVSHLITTVSTSKLPLLTPLLGDGLVDEVIDYTTQDVAAVIKHRGGVDFVFDTIGLAWAYFSLTKRDGLVLSIASVPPGRNVQQHNLDVPWWALRAMDAGNAWISWRARRWGVGYEMLNAVACRRDMETMKRLVEEGKLRAVVGTMAQLKEVEVIKEACERLYQGKGGVGRLVIVVWEKRDEGGNH